MIRTFKTRFLFVMTIVMVLALSSYVQAYNEAPMLTEKVNNGEIPAVEDRLPAEPKVVPVYEKIGEYGGTLVKVFTGRSDSSAIRKLMIETPMWFDYKNREKLAPNIFKGVEVLEKGKIIRCKLREGLKWSDGHPYTAEDLLFWYNDMLLYTPQSDMQPVAEQLPWLMVGDALPEVSKISEYEVEFKWPEPNPLFPERLKVDLYISIMIQPAHYLKQYHPKYLDDVPDQGEEATKLYNEHIQECLSPVEKYYRPEMPSLDPWVTKVWDKKKLLMERNPYYWKVDEEGNQLPYIDYVRFDVVEKRELANMKAMAGEIDFQFRHLNFSNYTAFVENEEKGGYRTLTWQKAVGASPQVLPNWNCEDDILREIIRNKKFRMALSLAINRSQINETLWYGLATPMQATTPPGTPYYMEGIEKTYADFDLERANQLLDEIGLQWDKNKEFRLRPDGETLALDLELMSPGWPAHVESFEMIRDTWAEIGVQLRFNTSERSLFHIRLEENKHDITHWAMDRVIDPVLDPQSFLPVDPGQNGEAPLYAKWYETNGEEGKAPEGIYKELYDLYNKCTQSTDSDERVKLMKEMVKLRTENLLTIGTVGAMPVAGVASKNLRNVPEKEISATLFRAVRISSPEQFFFEKE